MYYNQLVSYPVWIHHDNNSFLSIPKNACTTVKDAIFRYHLNTGELDEKSYGFPNENVRWTVIRDPYERLISGLAYDIKKTGVDKKIVLDNFEDSLYGTMSPVFRSITNETHTFSQTCYFMGQQLDVYVDINDLDLFLEMNFGYQKVGKINEVELEYKDKAIEIIEIFGKQRVKDILSFDTFIYNTIKNSADIWKWQNGKIFNEKNILRVNR